MTDLSFYAVETASLAVSLDLGAVAPASSDDTMLRIQNTGGTYQAQDVTVSVSDTSDSIQLWLSDDGDTFTATITVGDIPPGGSSSTFWLRRVTPSDASIGGCSGALNAVPGGWVSPVDTSSSGNIPLSTED